MKESDSDTIFSSSTNEELLAALRDIHSMNTEKVILLKQEFINREMFEESFAIDTFFSGQFDPSKLSLKEIQELVSERLQTGESIESIKSDLADHGVTLAELIENEGERIDTVFEKIALAKESGVDEHILDAELKEQYNYSEEELVQVKANMKKRAIVYKILGIGVIVLSIVKFLLKLYAGYRISIVRVILIFIVGFLLYANGVRSSKK